MIARIDPARYRQTVLRSAGIVAATGYVLWNIFWLWRGQVPPAILRALTGLPAPTTGATRAVMALARGDVASSLQFNPMAAPITALLMLSLGYVAAQVFTRRRVALPQWFLTAWIVTLALAEVLKLAGSPAYW